MKTILEHILAKSAPKETLIDHTENVISVWNELKLNIPDWYKPNDFDEKAYLAIMFHDFGKITLNFQDRIQGRRKNYDEFIRHEFFSGCLLWLTDTRYYAENYHCLMAVFTHHKPLHDQLFQNDSLKRLKISVEDLKVLLGYAQQKALKAGVEFKFSEEIYQYFQAPNSLSSLYLYFKQLLDRISTSATENDRNQYILYKSVLQVCDWMGSGHEKLSTGIHYAVDGLQEKIVNKLLKEGKTSIASQFQFRVFQNESLKEGSVIAVAPTGSGKTEAALIWASQKKASDRIIYLLPTRVTSNAIYKRLCTYFGNENCALIHSSAFLFRKEEEDEKGNTEYSRHREYLKEKTFFRNVNVCTVDQILTQGFNLGYWEIKTFHCSRARIIIDEIHLYEPWTLGLIISTMTYLKEKWGATFFVMTATMPKKLLALLQETLKIEDKNIIRDHELLNAARNIFEVRDFGLEGILQEVLLALKDAKKVLLVVNTVNDAIELFEKLRNQIDQNIHVICYHSRFIQDDRRKKEEEIFDWESSKLPVLLIATQVVEVSLDIDFDILFTENAPIDALIQRAGRVNRKRQKKETKVVVFQHSEISEKWIYNLPGILEKTKDLLKSYSGKALSERLLLEMVDIVYADIDITKNQSFQEGKKAYHTLWRENFAFIKDNLNKDTTYTREGLDTKNVIPDKFYEELAYSEDVLLKSKHEVAVRGYKALGTMKDAQKFEYLKCDYTYETGLKFLKNDEAPATPSFMCF